MSSTVWRAVCMDCPPNTWIRQGYPIGTQLLGIKHSRTRNHIVTLLEGDRLVTTLRPSDTIVDGNEPPF